ncbi:hypothetical protein [Dictyobacter arantiisoli]|uniref:Uncharacterized protein n=1 Tax=Dictyobacter arantiisoli TaxID=2014874 RepID=A0A5A5T8S8_9CHLR|nr:hypothetical protein [Dictyobacter arantiisoli]GCF07881.1 hypothetical protein KDI_14450 [Dictyobacter arantiisoli]
MSNMELVNSEQVLIPLVIPEKFDIVIPGAPPVRLQTLDLARHVAVAPDGKDFVVATFTDTNMGRTIVTAVFPLQGHYLTLVRLPVCEYETDDPEVAIQRHITLVQAIQQGQLKAYVKKNQ